MYGGKGIKVCDTWQYSFDAFAADMGPHPGKGLTLDRINTYGNYEPGNCRWTDMKTQNRNRRYPLRDKDVAHIRLLYKGDARSKRNGLSHQAIADMYGVGRTTITNILLRNSWS